jgi:nucleotide-binding universal stress UspA family protein
MLGAVEHPRRLVIVLGRRPAFDVESVARSASSEGIPLLFLSLGYPVGRAQAELVAAAVELSVELGVHFEAVLVPDEGRLLEHFNEGDDVTFVLEPREGRRLRAKLRGRGRARTDGSTAPGARSRGYRRSTLVGSGGSRTSR